ncbi:MAG: VWA domain-containing protein [Bryobacteraceae bacterium]|nr:VWA domain-containing protein [Bryobacteraceae bacterium]
MRTQRNHREKQKGVTLILTAMAAGVVLPLVGLSIDAGVLYAIKAKLQAAADAGALAGARSLNRGLDLASQSDSARATALAFFNANFPEGHFGARNRSASVTITETAYRTRTVRVDATVTAPTWFLGLLGIRSTEVRATGMSSRRDVNMVLVLDRSSSMSGAMSAMRNAARMFADKFAEGRDRVGLIVFGGASVLAFPNPSPSGPSPYFKSASPNVDTLISRTVNGGNTGTAQALWMAYQELVKLNEAGALNLIVFFTDGLPNGIVADFNVPEPSQNLLRATSGCKYRLVQNRPMIGFISQTSGFAPTGNTVGIKLHNASTVSSVNEGVITTNSDGCAFRNNQNYMRQDVARMPARDYYGNATTGYVPVDLTRVDSPQQIGYASLNAADHAVRRIRQDSALNVVIYSIGYYGGNEYPDEEWLKRVANDPRSSSFDPSKPPGLYVRAPTAADLNSAFATVASEILRLAL